MDDLKNRLAGIAATLSDMSLGIGSVQANIRQIARQQAELATKMEDFMSATGDQIGTLTADLADIKTAVESGLGLAQQQHSQALALEQQIAQLQQQIASGAAPDLTNLIATAESIRGTARQTVDVLAPVPPQIPNEPGPAPTTPGDTTSPPPVPVSSG